MVRFALSLQLVVSTLCLTANAQVGYLWSFDELRTRAELVVLAEWIKTEDTGRQVEHPDLRPALPAVEMRARFRVLTVLKDERPSGPVAVGSVFDLQYYRFERERWQREHPGVGVLNGGATLQFGDGTGPFLLFLKRGPGAEFVPLSGQTFPTDSVFRLLSGRPRG